MRRRPAIIAGVVLISGLVSVAGVTPAAAIEGGWWYSTPDGHSVCPEYWRPGTVPGTSPSVTTIGTGGAGSFTTVYVDDRDLMNFDADTSYGGLWIYVESNGRAGLQRGGTHVVFGISNPSVASERLSHHARMEDGCRTDQNGQPYSGPPDTILF